MQLIADESVDFSIVLALRKYGVEVLSIAEQNPSIMDEEVLNIAVNLGAPLITEDKDFGELVFRLKLPHRGIVLLRLGHIANETKGDLAAKTIVAHVQELPDAFTVYDGFALRIRKP